MAKVLKQLLKDRINRFDDAVERYETYEENDDVSSTIRDMLTDLRHYCKFRKFDFDEIVLQSEHLYEEEIDD